MAVVSVTECVSALQQQRQVNQLRQSDFRYDVIISRWRPGHDVISRRKLLPPGEWTRSVWPAPVPDQ